MNDGRQHDPYAGAPRVVIPAVDTVPEGTAEEILRWVGEDKEKALEAVEYEKSQEKPRKTLLTNLKKIAKNE